MLRPRWRKVLGDAALHKARTALAFLAIVIGLTAACALLDAWALVRRATAETYLASAPVSATLKLDAVDADLVRSVAAIPGIAAVRARRALIVSEIVDGARLTSVLYALDDFARTDIGVLHPEAGAWPPREGEVAIEHSAMEYAHARLNESVEFRLEDHATQTLRVTGSVRDVSLAPGWMDHVVHGFVTPGTLAQLGAEPGFNELQFVASDANADRAATRRLAYAVKAFAEQRGRRVLNVDVPEPRRHVHAAQMDSLMLVQGAFAALTLLVCACLIVNLMGAMLAGQSREIGVMKTLGAGKAALCRLYLAFALALGLCAAAVALPLGLVLGQPYATLKGDMLNFSIDGFSVPWWIIVAQALVGCIVPVAAAAFPVLRACRVDVSDALRDNSMSARACSVRGRWLPRLAALQRPLLLSLGNAFRQRQRMLLTMLALAAGGAVFVGAQNLRSAVSASVDQLFASSRYDVMLRLVEPATIEGIQATARSVSGVQAVEAWTISKAAVAHADNTLGDSFALIGVPIDSKMLAPELIAGRWLKAGDLRSVVVASAMLRDEPQMIPGAALSLVVDGQAGIWTIVGVADSGVQPVAYVPRAVRAEGSNGQAAAASVVIATSSREPAAQLDAIARLRVALGNAGMAVAGSQLLSENRRVFEDHLLMVVQFLGAMAWIMIGVGGIGLASTMSMAVLERTREIGVMRALGARHAAILWMIQVESLVIGLLSWLLALIVSIPISAWLAAAFGRIMFPVPAHWLPGAQGALAWLGLVVIVALLASAWPAVRAMRVPTAAALSYE